MKNVEATLHVRGEAEYIDDVLQPANLLHAAVFGSPEAHARVVSLDTNAAQELEGVVRVITAADIPGVNEIGPIIHDEPLLAEDVVRFIGHPLAVVYATSPELARLAVSKIQVDLDPLPVVVDPREAYKMGHVIGPSRTFELGNVENAWSDCAHIVEGKCEIGGQEHVYLETQRARAIPLENNRVQVFSSTQSPYAGQKHIARVLGVPNHDVEVDVKRIGGGFGGKEDQATHWACFAALGAYLTRQPVEIVLRRHEDMTMTGKRHPYSADFKLGADHAGTIIAYEASFYQNAGAAADLSPGVLERTLYHATNSYFIPNAKLFAASCRTNIPPNTAFRGFGGPQGMFVIESAITALAEKMNLDRATIQRNNLLQEGDQFPYGQKVTNNRSSQTWDEAEAQFDFPAAFKSIEDFNASSKLVKKGVAVMPVCFGISFTTTFLNQASALVHVYTDGSVGITPGGIERGQGLFTNIVRIASEGFGIDPGHIRIESTNTTRVANMSPSAASSTTLLNGNATLIAVKDIRSRLLRFARAELNAPGGTTLSISNNYVCVDGNPSELSWADLIERAYRSRIGLSSYGFFSTPNIHFDKSKEKGNPFAYHTCGTAIIEVTVDCLRGRYDVDSVKIVHDGGRPLSRIVDIGQIEGGLAQGLGWMTMEDLRYSDDGRLMSANLASYKVPDAYFMPDDIQVSFLEDASEELGPFGSKAVGEPPLMYGIGVYFAIRQAMRSFTSRTSLSFDAPMTPERVLLGLYPDFVHVANAAKVSPQQTEHTE